MRLAAVQSAVRALLLLHPSLSNVVITLDDGTGEAHRDRMVTLKTKGLWVLVWRVEDGDTISSSRTGVVVQRVPVFVFVEELMAVNRAAGGTGVTIEDAIESVLEALSGARVAAERVQLDNPAFTNFGKVNGINRGVVAAFVENTVNPITP